MLRKTAGILLTALVLLLSACADKEVNVMKTPVPPAPQNR
jgi:protein involved in sex pheromone biosynthesis